MPRPQKPLEEQLTAAQEELRRTEEKVIQIKQRIADIKQQIEERNMRDAYSLLKQNNMTVEQLEKLISSQKKK